MVILNRMEPLLQTSSALFDFKSKRGTEQCVYLLKELIRVYARHESAIHVEISHASKAFDRVNIHKRLTKLEQRQVPNYILRLLISSSS